MCGIAGYIGPVAIPEERRRVCLARMRHRGPDDAGEWSEVRADGTHVHLLHRRLRIIDLDPRANQPFVVGSRRLIYNGELYNYLEVRRELEAKGVVFETSSDTEVLLKAIAHSGIGVLDTCEGMWAFAVYDEADGTLVLSRDRFGEKPLYVYQHEGGLYFGSEIKFITTLLGRRLPIDYDHLSRYLVNGYKALYKTAQTFYQGLRELPPASIARVDGHGHMAVERYWEPRHEPEAMSYAHAVDGVRERMLRSVELRLRADVPLAFCMSGGIDSNSLIAVAKCVYRYDVHGFTIANSDSRYEEQGLVDHVVERLKLRHTSIAVETGDFLGRLRAEVVQHDGPVSTISYYAHLLLMEQIAAAGYRVSVSGTAADELFSGYYDHHLLYLHAVRGDPTKLDAARTAWEAEVKPLVRNPFLQKHNAFIDNPALRDHIFLNADKFSSFITSGWSEPFAERQFTSDVMRNRMLNEMFEESVPVILHEDDLNAMTYSIENRSPFLDRELFEFAYRVPTEYMVRNGRAKALLRDAMRGIVPDAVLDNPRKVGFNAPIEGFLDLADRPTRDALLADSPIFDHVRRECVQALVERGSLLNSESKFLFNFLNSKMFLEEFSG